MEPEARVVDWLLDGDAAVRWQVHRDVLDSDPEVVQEQRSLVAASGWGARLLAEQADDGTWGEGLYSPKWTSTTYTLLLLWQLGLPSDHPAAQRGCERLLGGVRVFGGGLTLAKTVDEPETCITAMVIALMAAFDRIEVVTERAMVWLLDQQLADGGWNCETVRVGSRHGSFDTTIMALEAVQAWIERRGEDDRVVEASERGRAFFLDHRLYCSHRTGEVVHPSYTRMVFPPGWHHDLLRGLDHFQAAGAPADEGLSDAIELLLSKRRPDGTWVVNARHPGRHWFRLEAGGRPSRINTLRALRVLRWWSAASS